MDFNNTVDGFSCLNLKQKQILFLFQKELMRFRSLFLTKKNPEKEIGCLIKDGVLSGIHTLDKIPKGALVDAGSGAGFPGIVWAVLDESRPFILIEPSLKRSEFLKHCISSLRFHHRIEVRREKLAFIKEKLIVFKAFASLKKTLKQVKKYLPKDGRSYHLKSAGGLKEWNEFGEKEKQLWNLKILADYNFERKKRFVLEISRNL